MRKRLLIAISASMPIVAAAQTAPVNGTNFPALQDYPAPACAKPGEPPKKPNTRDNMEIDSYNAKLAVWNKAGHAYVVCINAYVRNADNDADLIRKKARDAVDAANQ